jgi:hypothetical protein
MYIPSTQTPWIDDAVKDKKYDDISTSRILDRPIIAWFNRGKPECLVHILTKVHPASNVDLWTVVNITKVSGCMPNTLQSFIGSGSFMDKDLTLCEFEDSTSFVRALTAFMLQV